MLLFFSSCRYIFGLWLCVCRTTFLSAPYPLFCSCSSKCTKIQYRTVLLKGPYCSCNLSSLVTVFKHIWFVNFMKTHIYNQCAVYIDLFKVSVNENFSTLLDFVFFLVLA